MCQIYNRRLFVNLRHFLFLNNINTGAPLHEVDIEDQARLVKHLFYLVRAGRADEAQKLCIESGQCWRAAVIDGWRVYNDPNFSNLNQQRYIII